MASAALSCLCTFAPLTFLSLLSIVKPLGNGNRHLLLLLPRWLNAYLQLLRPQAPITAPRETDHFDGQILRGASHAESKNTAERLAGFGCVGWKRGGGGRGSAGAGGLLQACRIVFTGFLQFGCQNEMKAELMRSRQSAETFCHREHGQCRHTTVKIIEGRTVLNCTFNVQISCQNQQQRFNCYFIVTILNLYKLLF